jgi:hypothetical protein
VSQRRACQVIDADRSTVRYRSRRPDDGSIRVRLRELAAIRRRFGYGTYETPEFQRQTREFFAAVKAFGKPVQLFVGEGYNHFELLETLANPYGLVGRAALEQMGLVPA